MLTKTHITHNLYVSNNYNYSSTDMRIRSGAYIRIDVQDSVEYFIWALLGLEFSSRIC